MTKTMEIAVAAISARAVVVSKGQTVRVIDVDGRQPSEARDAPRDLTWSAAGRG